MQMAKEKRKIKIVPGEKLKEEFVVVDYNIYRALCLGNYFTVLLLMLLLKVISMWYMFFH